jgi:hypothetical protein
MERLMIGMLAGVIALAAGPTVAGYAYAIAALPVYGAACHPGKVFGSAIGPDGYRIFLLGRGCDVDAAVRAIASQAAAATGLDIDPMKIAAIYRGSERAEEGDESLAIDIVQASLREFKLSVPGKTDCATGGDCTNAGQAADPIAGLPGSYLTFARAHFLDALDDGADYISWLLHLGLAVQILMFLAYGGAALLLGTYLTRLAKRIAASSPARGK